MTEPLPPTPTHGLITQASRERWLGAGLCALSAAGFSTLAILGKLAYSQGMRIFEILGLRFAGASLLLGAYLILTRRRAMYPGPRIALALLTLGAIGYGGQATLYFAALQRNPASISALLLYVYPVFVAVLAWGIRRKPPLPREWAAMGLALTGVALTLSPAGLPFSRRAAPLDKLGIAFVIASAAWYAGYILVSDHLVHKAGPLVSSAWIAFGAFFSFATMAWVTNTQAVGLTPAQGLTMLGMIIFSTILPVLTFLAGLARVGPTPASLLSTLEPVFTILLAAVFLSERLSAWQLAGGGFVLAAVLLLNLPSRPAPRP